MPELEQRREELIRQYTRASAPALCPELSFLLADQVAPLWAATETFEAVPVRAPPFWAFAWPGSQALARYVLNTRACRDRRVLDFAAGCGTAALAAARDRARSVVASELDPFAVAALRLNAGLNGLPIDLHHGDLVDQDAGWEIVLVGDVHYEEELARRVTAWLSRLAARGARVLLGDGGRAFLPGSGLVERASFVVPTSRDWENVDQRVARVWELAA